VPQAGLSLQWPRLAPGSVHVGLRWIKWHWDRFYSELFQFLPVSIIPLWLSIVIYHLGVNNRPAGGHSSET
jgi:hypothetical protein